VYHVIQRLDLIRMPRLLRLVSNAETHRHEVYALHAQELELGLHLQRQELSE
jgi:hypothetical protein